MTEFNKNDKVKHDKINKIIILNKQGSVIIHDVIPTKYHKYFQPQYLNMQTFWLKEINHLSNIYTI